MSTTNFRFLALFLFMHRMIISNGFSYAKHDEVKLKGEELCIGAILDSDSRAGKEEKVAIKMAVKDFYGDHQPPLHIKNSRGDSVRAAFSAKTLIKKHNAKVILGLGTWQEASFAAELGNKSKVPILSFANDAPSWAFSNWPFLINAARSQFAQMKAVAAIIRSWQWRKVNVVYEDINSASNGIIPYLVAALQEENPEINELVPLPPSQKDNYLSDKLKTLKDGQCRVFIVHTHSITLGKSIFNEAKKLGMMENEYVWVTTSSIADIIDTLSPSTLSTMQGVLGVKTHYYDSGKRFEGFRSRFRAMFRRHYPKESYTEPGTFALQAYDAVRAIALSTKRISHRKYLTTDSNDDAGNKDSLSGQILLNRILDCKFEGLTGTFNYRQGILLPPRRIYRIINIVGKSYNELGYWSEGLGFSTSSNKYSVYDDSMQNLRQVSWPGGHRSVPRGWAVATSEKPLRIGVPTAKGYREFISVNYDNDHPDSKPNVTGFSVDVFKKVIGLLPYNLPYNFVPFHGTYDSMVKQLQLEKFDAVVADTAIVANRCKYGEFSQPYTDSGLQMLIHAKPRRSDRTWLFQKPFTYIMWATTGAVVLYNGFVVWIIERKHNPEFTKGTKFNQFGTMVSFSFTTLFSLQGAKLHSNLSRMTMIVFLFVALIVINSYTASLTTLLTAQRLDPTIVDIETLKRTGAKVGCDGNSFVFNYLEVVLGFKRKNIKKVFSEEEYTRILMSGEIAAAFLEVPYVKVFLAKNCKRFVQGPIFKVGGFGYVFHRSSPYLPDISRAILEVSENGTLRELENSLTSSYNCSNSNNDKELDCLDLDSFSSLFLITVGTSTASLIAFIVRYALQKYRYWHLNAKVQPQLLNSTFDENWILDIQHIHENASLHQPKAYNHWLSAWERENQVGHSALRY